MIGAALKQSVAMSVLDKPGQVKEIKLRSGRQAFVERLQQLVTAKPAPGAQPLATAPASDQRKLPTDRGLAFAQLAAGRINGAFVRCEERYPDAGLHSVLMVVVERDSAQWQEQLKTLHGELFGPGKIDPLAPVQLEVVDRTTDEAIQRLIEAGLISRTTRPLFPAEQSAPKPLSAEEQAASKAHRERGARKLKIARLLGESSFGEEARPALLDAIHAMGCSLAVEGRLPAPHDVKDTLRPPLSSHWADVLPFLKAFVHDPAAAWGACCGTLGKNVIQVFRISTFHRRCPHHEFTSRWF